MYTQSAPSPSTQLPFDTVWLCLLMCPSIWVWPPLAWLQPDPLGCRRYWLFGCPLDRSTSLPRVACVCTNAVGDDVPFDGIGCGYGGLAIFAALRWLGMVSCSVRARHVESSSVKNVGFVVGVVSHGVCCLLDADCASYRWLCLTLPVPSSLKTLQSSCGCRR